jgi:hypothetical protein
MRIFLTIALSFLWLNSFSQEKTIVVKKSTIPEFTLNGKFKNNDFLSKSLFNKDMNAVIKNCNCSIVSFEILYPTGDGTISTIKQTNDVISPATLALFRNLKPGEVIVFHSILLKDEENREIRLPTSVYKIVP